MLDKEARFFERIVRTRYWRKMPEVVERIPFGNRTFFSRYRRIDAPLTDTLIERHRRGEITIAHDLVDAEGRVPHIVVDYHGENPERFYHHAGRTLYALGRDDLVTFRSRSGGHLHLYVACDGTALQEAIEMGKIISKKLEEKLSKQWRVFPTDMLPEAYNIMNLPYEPFSLSPAQGAFHAR